MYVYITMIYMSFVAHSATIILVLPLRSSHQMHYNNHTIISEKPSRFSLYV